MRAGRRIGGAIQTAGTDEEEGRPDHLDEVAAPDLDEGTNDADQEHACREQDARDPEGRRIAAPPRARGCSASARSRAAGAPSSATPVISGRRDTVQQEASTRCIVLLPVLTLGAVRVDHEDGAPRVLDDLVGDAGEHERLQCRAAAGAEHDRRRLVFVGDLGDPV